MLFVAFGKGRGGDIKIRLGGLRGNGG